MYAYTCYRLKYRYVMYMSINKWYNETWHRPWNTSLQVARPAHTLLATIDAFGKQHNGGFQRGFPTLPQWLTLSNLTWAVWPEQALVIEHENSSCGEKCTAWKTMRSPCRVRSLEGKSMWKQVWNPSGRCKKHRRDIRYMLITFIFYQQDVWMTRQYLQSMYQMFCFSFCQLKQLNKNCTLS